MLEYFSTRKSIDKSPINLKRKQSCPFKVIIKYFFYLHIKQLFLNFILLVVILILKIKMENKFDLEEKRNIVFVKKGKGS